VCRKYANPTQWRLELGLRPCRHYMNTRVVLYLKSRHDGLHNLACIFGRALANTTRKYNFLIFYYTTSHLILKWVTKIIETFVKMVHKASTKKTRKDI
jgi:hypothetical protein